MAFTFFFRDYDCLNLAIQHMLPQIAGRHRVHIWDAGCAMGHEPYTLAMLLAEKMGVFGFRSLEIHATDYNASLLEVLARGIYSFEDLKRVPAKYLEKYFEELPDEDSRFRVVDRLRKMIKTQAHDLLSLKPIRDSVSLIVCKNVLLHFPDSDRIQVVRMFHRALEAGGLFVTEHTQNLPEETTDLFIPIAANRKLYQKKETDSHGQ